MTETGRARLGKLGDEPISFLMHLPSSRATTSSHLVAQFNDAGPIGFDFREMEGDVSVEPLEEWDPVTNQDRQNRIRHFVGQSENACWLAMGSLHDALGTAHIANRFVPNKLIYPVLQGYSIHRVAIERIRRE